MKNFTGNAKLFTLLLFAGLLFYVGRTQAQSIQIGNGENQIKITDNSYNQLSLQNIVTNLSAFDVKATQGEYSQLKIDGYGYSMEVGKPKLPVIKKLIEVPLEATFELIISYESYKDINLSDFGVEYPIIPAQPSLSKSIDDPSMVEFRYDALTYNTDNLYGTDLVKIVPLGIMRGIRMARIEIAPVKYNPVQNIIRVFDNIKVDIQFTGADVSATLSLKKESNNPYFSGIGRLLFNYKPIENTDELIEYAPITYIIVSDPMFETALQPFIQWKTKKGFKVVEAYTNDPGVGNTTSSIKTYLKNFYQNPPEGYNPQSFVLFVGDVAQIPAFTGTTGGHVTDLYFCEYTNDIFPECYYGRFSATNLNQLQPQIDKTLEYEQYLMPDPTFLDEVVMVTGADGSHQLTWGNGQINYGTTYYFNAEHGIYSHTYLQPEPGGGNYSQNIRQNVSDGVSYANYTAHCSPDGWADPSFSISHINALTNAHKYPLMVGNCCSSVEFQTTCFGEEILRAANKGALGYIGGSNSTYWDEDFWWGVGFESISANPPYNPQHLGAYDRTFHDREGITLDDWFCTQGQMPSAGNLAVSQSGSSLEDYYWEIYHLMGDPSVMIYFSQPPDITATYAGLMPIGSPTFTINTEPFAYVAVSKEGVLHGTALADADGIAEVEFELPITVPGNADVVITGQNLKPFFGTVAVASPEGPYVLLDEFTINDATTGNGNNQLDYGESVNIGVSMKNLGQDIGQNISLMLTTADEFITINNGSASLGNINPGEIITLADAFGIAAAENIPDDHTAAFILTATNGTDSWVSNFGIKGHAPAVGFVDFTVNDQSGNNNGKLDPGETAQMVVSLDNTGTSEAYNVIGGLTSSSVYITVVTTDPQEFGNIAPGATKMAAFQVTASAATPAGHMAVFTINFTGDLGVAGQGDFSTVVGQIPVLIVDLDENNNSASDIASVIEELGVAAEITTSLPADLSLYSSIFVCLGIYSENHVLTSAEGTALANYLNNGGMLYMEGGDTWYYDDQTAVHPMFGITGQSDGSGDLGTINGVAGTITEGLSYSYNGDNNWIDQLAATGTAVVIFNNANPAYACAVSNETATYSTIGASFEFGGLGSRSSQLELMETYLEYFEITGNVTMTCNMQADPDEICQGDNSQFNVQVFGGSGNYTYAWSPETGLSNPGIANPVASPLVTTTYTVTITDVPSGNQISDVMTLQVNSLPTTPEIVQTGDNLVSNAQNGNQWYNENGAIPGATGQIFSPTALGNYYTIVTNTFGCHSAPSNIIFYQPTFIDELEKEGTFRVYPNPAKDIVTIDYLVNADDYMTITLHNAFGQTLYTLNTKERSRSGLNTVSFDMSPLDAGVYYFKLQNTENTMIRKIILSK